MGSNQFFILIESTADAAFAVDGAGRISAWNSAAAELFGVSKAEVMGINCHRFLQCSDENGILCSDQCVVESAAQDNHPRTSVDLRLQTKSGKLWCNLSTLIASDASGARHAIHIVRPREVRKRLEQIEQDRLRAKRAKAERDASGQTETSRKDSG